MEEEGRYEPYEPEGVEGVSKTGKGAVLADTVGLRYAYSRVSEPKRQAPLVVVKSTIAAVARPDLYYEDGHHALR